MPPRKLTTEKPKRTNTAQKTTDRVVKRPARGYHRFKDGSLNVTPKGSEKQTVEDNQGSPLLRLPPEIRNRIWGYAVGGKAFRETYFWGGRKPQLLPQPCERVNIFSLLRVCRQIYAETAILLLTTNTFSLRQHWSQGKALNAIKSYQRKHVHEIQIEMLSNEFYADNIGFLRSSLGKTIYASFPELQRIRIRMFPFAKWDNTPFHECEQALRSAVEFDLRVLGHELLVEKMDTTLDAFEKKWLSGSADA